jgi:hypothetical protein
MRLLRNGTTALATPEQRFWTKVNKLARDGCWEWLGSAPKRPGYGRFNTGIKRAGNWVVINAHRYSWELHNGPVPKGLWVLHRCDNRVCIRPDHLFLGSVTDNNRDMIAKGRHWRQAGR